MSKSLRLIPRGEFPTLGDSSTIASRDRPFCTRVASGWLQRCVNKHKCGKQVEDRVSKKLPTRLLQLDYTSDDFYISLVTGKRLPRNTRYATLSHCWGGKLPLKLTKKNLERYTRRIPVEDLTVKFRQTIQATKGLGINYLWIDSLCILQDSKSDWEKESSRMGNIYEGASINIAAVSASDSNAPLFSNTVRNSFQDYLIEVPHISGGPFLCCDEGIWQRNISVSPLLRRAWVLQELLLAPRILYFCQDQMFWECSEFQACEQWPDGIPERITAAEQTIRLPRADENYIVEADTGIARFINPFFGLRSNNMGVAAQSRILPGLDTERTLSRSSPSSTDGQRPFRHVRRNAMRSVHLEEHETDLRHLWPEIITRYSRADLSFPNKDKLAAVSAVAKRLFPPQIQNYLAGHWKDQMPSCLAWRSVGFVKRLEGYQAPSWSWASVNGPVRIPSGGTYNPHLSARVLKAHTKSSSKDPTGRVESGSILLQTTMLKVKCHNYRESISFVDPDRFTNVTLCQAGSCHLRLYPDCVFPQPGEAVHLMVLEASISDRESPQDSVYGLLISPTRKKGVYQRTGYFEVFSGINQFGALADSSTEPFSSGSIERPSYRIPESFSRHLHLSQPAVQDPHNDKKGKDKLESGSFVGFISLCQEFHNSTYSQTARNSAKNQITCSDVLNVTKPLELHRPADKIQVPGFVIEIV